MKKTILFSLSLLLLLVWKPNSPGVCRAVAPVHVGQGCEVDNEVVNIGKSAGDEVVWSSDGDAFHHVPRAGGRQHKLRSSKGGCGDWSLPGLYQ